MENLVSLNRQVRNLILDYALGAAILVLLPIPHLMIVKAIALGVLHYRIIRDVGRLWGVQSRSDFLARLGSIFGVAGALFLALVGWVGMVALGALVPHVEALAAGVAAFAYFWGIGQTVHHFYLSGFRGNQSSAIEGGDDEV